MCGKNFCTKLVFVSLLCVPFFVFAQEEVTETPSTEDRTQASEVEATPSEDPTPSPVPEEKAVVETDTPTPNPAPLEVPKEEPRVEDVVTDPQSTESGGGHSGGDEETKTEEEKVQDALILNHVDTAPPPVTTEEKVPVTANTEVKENVEAPASNSFDLVYSGLDAHFNFDEPIILRFSTHGLPKRETETENSGGIIDGFLKPIFNGIIDYGKAVIERVVEITHTITDSVTDVFTGEDTKEGVEGKTEADVTVAPLTQDEHVEVPTSDTVPQTEEETQLASSTKDSEDTETIPSLESVANASSSPEVATTTPEIIIPTVDGPHISLFVDGVLSQSEVVWISETEFTVLVTPEQLLPGTHHAVLTYADDTVSASTSVEFTFGSNVVRTVVLSDLYQVMVSGGADEGETLWLLDTTNTVYSYQKLAEGNGVQTGSPINFREGSIFWVSGDGQSFSAYDVLARTYYSQSLESHPEAPVSLPTGEYLINVKNDTFNFDFVEEDKK